MDTNVILVISLLLVMYLFYLTIKMETERTDRFVELAKELTRLALEVRRLRDRV